MDEEPLIRASKLGTPLHGFGGVFVLSHDGVQGTSERAAPPIGHPGTETSYQKMKREADAFNFSVRVDPDELWWCNVHRRWASHMRARDQWHHCDPALGGIMIPCNCVDLTELIEVVER